MNAPRRSFKQKDFFSGRDRAILLLFPSLMMFCLSLFVLKDVVNASDTPMAIVLLIVGSAALILPPALLYHLLWPSTAESRQATFEVAHKLDKNDVACVFDTLLGQGSVIVATVIGRVVFERCHWRGWRPWAEREAIYSIDEIQEIVPPYWVHVKGGRILSEARIKTPDGWAFVPSGSDRFADILRYLMPRVPSRRGREQSGLAGFGIFITSFAVGVVGVPTLASMVWPQLSPEAFAWWFLGGFVITFVIAYVLNLLDEKQTFATVLEAPESALTPAFLDDRFHSIASGTDVSDEARRLRDLLIAVWTTGRPYGPSKAYRDDERARGARGAWSVDIDFTELILTIEYSWVSFNRESRREVVAADTTATLVFIRALLDFAQHLEESSSPPWKMVVKRAADGPTPFDVTLSKRLGFDERNQLEIVMQPATPSALSTPAGGVVAERVSERLRERPPLRRRSPGLGPREPRSTIVVELCPVEYDVRATEYPWNQVAARSERATNSPVGFDSRAFC
jgi:hypothetical protein